MSRPFEQVIQEFSSLTIGTVESVSPNEIRVLLELEAPQNTALNTGVPTGFPRINSYVLVPNEVGAVVGMIVWLGVERSSFPKRKGLKDFDLIDLPFPLRKITVTPVGTLVPTGKELEPEGTECMPFRLDRGVTSFPSVGDPVLLPSPGQLRSIVEAFGEDRRIQIGVSPMAGGARVFADPDKLFGRHLAVLGNTGSGKSCTVAGLIRWSLEAARSAGKTPANARFIVLDPNGEYRTAFSDITPKPRVFRVHQEGGAATGPDEQDLHVPAWLWNSHEWSAFVAASYGIQRPLLMRALRQLRSGIKQAQDDTLAENIARNVNWRFDQITTFFNQGPTVYGEFKGRQDVGGNLAGFLVEIAEYRRRADQVREEVAEALKEVEWVVGEVLKNKKEGKYWAPFNGTELEEVLKPLSALVALFPKTEGAPAQTEDTPVPFDVEELADRIEALAAMEGGSTSQYISPMTTRIRTMLADGRLRPIIESEPNLSLSDWLSAYVGTSLAANGELGIIDLSLVPPDVIHVVIAVIARLVFEAMQRYVKSNQKLLPTVLVLEEAHTFISRDAGREGDVVTSAQMCKHTFERIAREGRKFGLGLVLCSQRPSELSQTVLAQCNTFLLHRIVNDEDQRLLSRLVPDNLGGLLRELSSLPSRRAVFLGWATEIPTLVEITELPLEQRPRSRDPDFWDVWTGKEPRPVDWEPIAAGWQLRRHP